MQVCACARLTHTDIVRVCQSVSGIDAGFPFGASDRKIPHWEGEKKKKKKEKYSKCLRKNSKF